MAVVNFTTARGANAQDRALTNVPRERNQGYRLPPFCPARRANWLGRIVDRLLGR